MKLIYTFFLLFTLFFSHAAFAVDVIPASISCTIASVLRVGSKGVEVQCLQKKVGAVADGLFGPLTRASVVAWQSNHGLSPDGVVGPLTRMALNHVVVSSRVYPPGCNSTTTYSITTGEKCDDSLALGNSGSSTIVPPTSPVVIPGTRMAVGSEMPESLKDPQKNLEIYIASVKKALLERGESPETISLFEESIRRSVAENPNATKQFFDAQREIYNKTISKKISTTLILVLLDKAFSFFDKTLFANEAQAADQLPFGGFISVYPVCTCTGGSVVQLYVSLPGAPAGISNLWLNYVNGTQAFLNRNIPEEGIAVLGFYNPTANEACTVYFGTGCSVMPAEGQILPMVGSSLSPG